MFCRAGEDAVEAQLDIGRLRRLLGTRDLAGPEISDKSARKLKPDVIYLGLYHFESNNNEYRELAIQQCVRAQVRATLKMLEVKGVDPRTYMDRLEAIV
jgi:hypothetical protein